MSGGSVRGRWDPARMSDDRSCRVYRLSSIDPGGQGPPASLERRLLALLPVAGEDELWLTALGLGVLLELDEHAVDELLERLAGAGLVVADELEPPAFARPAAPDPVAAQPTPPAAGCEAPGAPHGCSEGDGSASGCSRPPEAARDPETRR